MFGKEPAALVSIYAILFNNTVRSDYTGRNKTASGVKYAYVGSSDCIPRRMSEHTFELEHSFKNKFMQHVFNKYGIAAVVEVRSNIVERDRLINEQAVYDEYAAAGYELVNAITPIQGRCTDYSFRALQSYKEAQSAAQRRRYERQDEHDKQSIRMTCLYNSEDMQIKLHAAHNTPEAKQHHSQAAKCCAHIAGPKISIKAKQRYTDEDYKRRHAAAKMRHACTIDYINASLAKHPSSQHWQNMHKFYTEYATADIWRYDKSVGCFEPWMHFIIQDNLVTAFAWDTRQVQFTCNVDELPVGYVHVRHSYDSYQLLQY